MSSKAEHDSAAERSTEESLEAHPDGELEAVRRLERANDAELACDALEAVIARRPDDFDVREEAFWFHLRNARPEAAEAEAMTMIGLREDQPHGYLFLGNVRMILGRLEAAIEAYGAGRKVCPGTLELERAYGDACLTAGRLEDAQRSLHAALCIASREPESHFDIGRLRDDQGRFPDALQNYERALALEPEFQPALLAIGSLHRGLRRWPEAIAAYERVLEIEPDQPGLIAHLGNTLLQAGDLVAAEQLLERAWGLAPDMPEIISLVGGVDYFQGRYEAAGERLRRAADALPDHAVIQYNHAFLLLITGQLEEGWKAYEFGLETDQRNTRWFFERWDFEPLHDERLYISTEQGLGDEVMFASCLPDIVESADIGRCVVGCDPRLRPLFERSMPALDFVDDPNNHGEEQLQPYLPVGRQIAIGSLPSRYRRTEADFPSRSHFLLPDPERAASFGRWLSDLGDGVKVGISWRGGGLPLTQASRSIALSDWHPLLGTPGVRFVNLQYGDSADDLASVAQATGIVIHDAGLNLTADIDGLCALMSALDLVISIDNSTVHLAGAVGADTWVVLPARPDWRWMLERADSPWYGSLHLERRAVDEAPDAVMARLRLRLEGVRDARQAVEAG